MPKPSSDQGDKELTCLGIGLVREGMRILRTVTEEIVRLRDAGTTVLLVEQLGECCRRRC
jgi:hypothetical protein